ncbi:hypothetical protein [Hoeflea prorocentri]|uniref:Uncharacterized protein n=1 Tax=Hoeflea prorocentri TaxID=1922333 RepID=A0A9X3UKH7_9HYPH|nr:hypothetical protein [Hoeflea prorocentri]MCY6380556.1 hypothetical protein [Hoeflea prorocentri]MDA5398356.1 hypothetical protein [Hoeflea prorocentri]
MKKTYEKPRVTERAKLSQVTAKLTVSGAPKFIPFTPPGNT